MEYLLLVGISFQLLQISFQPVGISFQLVRLSLQLVGISFPLGKHNPVTPKNSLRLLETLFTYNEISLLLTQKLFLIQPVYSFLVPYYISFRFLKYSFSFIAEFFLARARSQVANRKDGSDIPLNGSMESGQAGKFSKLTTSGENFYHIYFYIMESILC